MHKRAKFLAAKGRKGHLAGMKTVIIIPARMASTRLPGKPLADIEGKPMIVRVMERASAAGIGPVYVACSEPEVEAAVTAHGGTAIMTDPDLPSGTDRIRAAINSFDQEGRFERVINLQGDLPTINPAAIKIVADMLDGEAYDITTLAVKTHDPREIADPNVVKAVVSFDTDSQARGRALYFTRARAPWSAGHKEAVWHHVGIYGYRREALSKFCDMRPSPLEQREKLEQLRALEAGMTIGVGVINSSPEGVDTPEDLARARHFYKNL